MSARILVLAKEPVPGRVKTRLCPPWTPEQAATLAAAALADTIEAVDATPAADRVLVIDGDWPVPDGWLTVPQCAGGLDERIAAAFADTREPGTPTLLIGMDTPQVTPELLTAAVAGLDGSDAMLGPAADGGWWALALREPGDARLLVGVPTSVSETGELTLRALRAGGLSVGLLPELLDVDTAEDAHAVAGLIPASRFAQAVAR
ncbi:glycosyltransferase A (GT-A) superfamily protein (DUF2064 family) [Allocatelliglobosispora scoriae]|uniref:Glycosyltransferase A (GT-A) superfamily protein (DUF2064 family) n=1 Tax=Allocatelliglobosispora scoriae TaxID=643052 RepID=A0A841C222_9ACTN|nr:DUF2064 domain-containing protein [Allocatelliglobosispora scoriae]MBB5873020.1 glycosyltransferase A (GT-A) superfamily protein (DUF2064 family) [Allocatelliglobosispora scoriae]